MKRNFTWDYPTASPVYTPAAIEVLASLKVLPPLPGASWPGPVVLPVGLTVHPGPGAMGWPIVAIGVIRGQEDGRKTSAARHAKTGPFFFYIGQELGSKTLIQ